MSAELWTLEQLPDQVAALLAEDYDGQRSGRVRELPNARTIRWYTTIGLVDRPLPTRGRAVRYGRRHVLQLAAVKKLQAQGLPLAEVQQRLIGASDRELAAIIGPAAAGLLAGPTAATTNATPGRGAGNGAAGGDGHPVGTDASPRAGAFWRRAAHPPPARAAALPATEPPAGAPSPASPPATERLAAEPPAAMAAEPPAAMTVVPAVRLGDSVTLVLAAAPRPPDAAELAAIREQAAALLDLLGRLGLAPDAQRGRARQ